MKLNKPTKKKLFNHGTPFWWVYVFSPNGNSSLTEGDVFWSEDRADKYYKSLLAKKF